MNSSSRHTAARDPDGTADGDPARAAWRPSRLLAVAVLALVLALTVEAVSFAGWWWLEGAPLSLSAAGERRLQLVADHDAAAAAELRREAEAAPQGPVLPDLGHFSEQMLHPFLGFVTDPDLNQVPGRSEPQFAISNLGFFRRPAEVGNVPGLLGPPPQVAESSKLRVGVFGGSVAYIFSFAARDELARHLAEEGVVESADEVEVVSYALPGYKQPQQLLALAWVLSLGERLDAVVNLDGFNDVTLGWLENASRNVHPYYPRSWRERVRHLPDLRQRQIVGEVAFHHRRRAEIARAFASGPLAHTATGNLVWLWLDRRAAAAAADAEARLAAYDTPRWWPAVARGPDFRDDREEVLTGSIRLWQRASRQMRALCAAQGIAYLHVLQPNQYLPGSKPLSAEERARAYRQDTPFAPLVRDAYPRLAEAGEALAEEGVAFHDLSGVFSDVEETLYVDTCCHFNRLGNARLAAAMAPPLADALRRRRGAPAERP